MQKRQYDSKIICFDFDGTLTLTDSFPKVQEPNHEMVALLDRLQKQGYYIIVNSARDTLDYDLIQAWLYQHDVACNQVTLKAKPVADLYIDDRSLFPSVDVLEAYIELYFSGSLGRYIDKLAYNEFQSDFAYNISDVPENVRELKKDIGQEDNFRVYLPISGGMDSITMWKMLEEAGTSYRMFYFDFGQEYAQLEIDTIKEITGKEPIIIRKDIQFKRFKHIVNGRNAIIVLLLAEEMRNNNEWGEIWFGNLQGESPIVGGDKSRLFWNQLQQLLYLEGYQSRIINPLLALNKVDEVAYWQSRGEIETFKKTKSCFDGKVQQCGKCQTCFRKYVAFMANGIDISEQFKEGTEFQQFIDKYKRVMNEALKDNDFTHYSPARIRTTLEVINKLESK